MTSVKDIVTLFPFKTVFGSNCDDWADKFNHSFTTAILIIFAFVLTTAQFVSDPIHCWAPAEFTEAYVSYTKSYCWIKNTYFIPMDYEIPTNLNIRTESEITYYQWVPLIIMFMALMFKTPNILWKITNRNTGFSFKDAMKMLDKAYNGTKDEHEEAIKSLARLIDIWIRSHHYYQRLNVLNNFKARLSRLFCIYCNKKEGKYLAVLYFNVKLLYVINVIGQFYLLNEFLGMDYNSFGYSVLNGLVEGTPWPESPRFPKVTLCDFQIRQLQNIQRFSVQCVLPINLFNEKIFIFLWFWMFLVAVISIVNMFKWFFILMLRKHNKQFLKKYLKITKHIQTDYDRKMTHRFANYYLRDDGCFVLRIIGMNTSELIVIDLIEELWLKYLADSSQGRRPRTLGHNTEDTQGQPNTDDTLKNS